MKFIQTTKAILIMGHLYEMAADGNRGGWEKEKYRQDLKNDSRTPDQLYAGVRPIL